ncbi:MAG: GxxExxY protein [Verrucomicrobia bacterium]|nr:GxxExxY protein [Verrucomicrobiota bacterium]
MNTDETKDRLTEKIIGCAYTVANTLGCGFLEKVYENSLALELRKGGLSVEQQKPLTVFYSGTIVGEYFADLFVEQRIVVELKAGKAIDDSHVSQCLNYLKASQNRQGLIINFGPSRVEVRRLVMG